MSTTARDVMTPDCVCVDETETVAQAARRLASEGVGALPICGEEGRLKGMITDRDIAVRVVAEGRDPESCSLADLADGKPVTIGADDSVEEAIRTMIEHGVRRLPVIDGHDMIGIVAQADLARTCSSDQAGELLAGISS